MVAEPLDEFSTVRHEDDKPPLHYSSSDTFYTAQFSEQGRVTVNELTFRVRYIHIGFRSGNASDAWT